MPEASDSNGHGHVHGKYDIFSYNAGGVEEESCKQIFLPESNIMFFQYPDQFFFLQIQPLRGWIQLRFCYPGRDRGY